MKHSDSKSHDIFLLNSHMWQGATLLDSVDTKHFYHHRKFCWTVLV